MPSNRSRLQPILPLRSHFQQRAAGIDEAIHSLTIQQGRRTDLLSGVAGPWSLGREAASNARMRECSRRLGAERASVQVGSVRRDANMRGPLLWSPCRINDATALAVVIK